MNVSYLKEIYTKKGTSLAILNENQLKESLKHIINYYSTDSNKKGVLISFSFPAKTLLKELNEFGVNTKNVTIIDMVSGLKGEQQISGFKVIFIENPSNLTRLGIALEKSLKEIETEKFVVFDSISALNVYVGERDLEKFIYLLTTKISLDDNTGVVLTIKGSIEKNAIELIEQFFDNVYDFSEIFTGEIEPV